MFIQKTDFSALKNFINVQRELIIECPEVIQNALIPMLENLEQEIGEN